jgi:hypothetical protein
MSTIELRIDRLRTGADIALAGGDTDAARDDAVRTSTRTTTTATDGVDCRREAIDAELAVLSKASEVGCAVDVGHCVRCWA